MKYTYHYPLLKEISGLFRSHKGDFDNVSILACQHILEPQAKMLNLITDFGIPKENISIFGKIYSTSNEVLSEMKQEGLNVSKPSFDPTVPFDVEHRGNCEDEFMQFLPSVKTSSKVIILDDGGELLRVVNERFASLPVGVDVIGIEQTSSGFRKLENTSLHFPVFNVARSSIKLEQESPFIASLGCKRIVDVINEYSILEPRILVVGLGPIGDNMFLALNKKDYFTLGYDIAHHDKAELIDLIENNGINIVVGSTGTNIVNSKQLQKIKNEVGHNLYLVSMSSADREFPAVYIRKNGELPEEVHEDVVWDDLILINNGFPVTFKGNRNESTPEEMERTMALLYGSTLTAITKNTGQENGFTDVPTEVADAIEGT